MKPTALKLRTAVDGDLSVIIRMLAADPLGARRERFETPLPKVYTDAFDAISQDQNNELIVAESNIGIVGVLQITYIPNLTYQGRWRAQIEGVRVAATARQQGVGKAMLQHAIENARKRQCRLMQLTTDKTRPEAISFYENNGFRATHEGMKLHL